MATINEMKKEAIERMHIIGLLPSIIEEFEKDNILYYSELFGILYWVSNKPEWENHIRELEKKYNILVYHAEYSNFEFGRCLTLFIVDNNKKNWNYERKHLKDGISYCYVWNMDDPWCSEFGSIGFMSLNGGIKRIS